MIGSVTNKPDGRHKSEICVAPRRKRFGMEKETGRQKKENDGETDA